MQSTDLRQNFGPHKSNKLANKYLLRLLLVFSAACDGRQGGGGGGGPYEEAKE